MVRDSRVRMRDALVIPGTLLTAYGLLAIIYAEAFRVRSDFCADSNLILISGTCYTVWKLLLPLLVLGVGLIIWGAVWFRGEPEELDGHLRSGTPTHALLAFLISVVAVAGLVWLIQSIRQRGRTPFELNVLGVGFEHTFLLELVMFLGILMLAPALAIHIGAMRRHEAFLAAAEAAVKGVEKPLPHEPGFVHDLDLSPDQPEDMVPDEDWPKVRDTEPKEDAKPSEDAAKAEAAAAEDKPDAKAALTNLPEKGPGKIGEPIEEDVPAPTPPAPEPANDGRCEATTAAGNRCRVKAKDGDRYCGVHASKQ